MEKRPVLLVIVMIAAFVIAIGVASRFGGGASEGGGTSAKAPVKKFRAKAGTARENARALVSDIPSSPDSQVRPPSSRGVKRREVWNPPDEDSARRIISEEVARAVEEALGEASVGEGVAHIRSRLAKMQRPEGRSSLYVALAMLYAREEKLEEMREAYRMAASTSLSDAERVESVYEHARALLAIGRAREALELTEHARLGELEVSSRGLQLRLLSGMAQEELGNRGAAALVYEDVMARVSGAANSQGEDLDGVYRQAGLRAARVYRAAGKAKDAARVGRMMKNRVSS